MYAFIKLKVDIPQVIVNIPSSYKNTIYGVKLRNLIQHLEYIKE